MRRKQKTILLAILLTLVVGALGVFLLESMSPKIEQKQGVGMQVYRKERPKIRWNGQDYVLKDNLETILMIGLDKSLSDKTERYDNRAQSDFITLMVLDHGNRTVDLLELDRDTICEVPVLDIRGRETGTNTEQLALSHTYGTGGTDSIRNVMKATRQLLYDAQIDHYLRVSYEAVASLNDLVGGVEVTLQDDFSEFDERMTKGTTLTLKGKQAEIFVRSRYGMATPTNEARMNRQQVYMKGWVSQAQKALRERESILGEALAELGDELESDMSVYVLGDVADACLEYTWNSSRIPEAEYEVLDGHMACYPDEQKLAGLVVELMYEPCEEAVSEAAM